METATRALACTAWEWLPGMLSVETTTDHMLHRRRILQVEKLVAHEGDRVPFVQLELDGWRRLSDFAAVPDFSDLVTLHGLHALVLRAWAGHDVILTINATAALRGRNNIFIIAPDGKTRAHADGNDDLAALLVGALEAAPNLSR